MKTIYISIYKERHRKIGNGSIPPETAGESGREVKYCKRQAGPGFPHSSLATPLFMETIYIAVRHTSRQGQWKKASPGIVPLVFRTASEATRTASDF